MALDPSVRLMVTEAYEETVAEAMAQGQPAATAHREGTTAAAMFLASMSGLEDAAARVEVEALGLKPEQ
ncbi:MAG: hypothetical protein FD176_3200 [Rhodospirillaceae bacterium]|nr:MAG: hypothetical protein FD176_3200 [Rhodospirillaceae bacterium]TNC96430.1 MAG: hypothetical protein FD119_1737 [Stygiobacter sp.]